MYMIHTDTPIYLHTCTREHAWSVHVRTHTHTCTHTHAHTHTQHLPAATHKDKLNWEVLSVCVELTVVVVGVTAVKENMIPQCLIQLAAIALKQHVHTISLWHCLVTARLLTDYFCQHPQSSSDCLNSNGLKQQLLSVFLLSTLSYSV